MKEAPKEDISILAKPDAKNRLQVTDDFGFLQSISLRESQNNLTQFERGEREGEKKRRRKNKKQKTTIAQRKTHGNQFLQS